VAANRRQSASNDRIRAVAALESATALAAFDSRGDGLNAAEAAGRLAAHGRNAVTEHVTPSTLRLLLRAMANPLVVLLAVLAGFAGFGGDLPAAAIMAVMLALGVGLRFAQESRSGAAVELLRGRIRIHATALRDGTAVEVPIETLVPGDVVLLAAGDMVPADVRLLECKDLFVSQALLTGESFPVEKKAGPSSAPAPLDLENICWLGTSVESGTARAVVVATGRETHLGGIAAALEPPEPPTAFDVGMARFTWFMVALVAVMVPLVFLVNGLVKRDWLAAAVFALAVGVGLTPEMLPMIVSVCLARGALVMADRRVIVKHLDSIQNLGAMDVLCTDKTGTLTLDRIILERHCDLRLRDDPRVLELAWLNSHFQTGLASVMDRAILAHRRFDRDRPHAGYEKVDEIPFDFARRVMSVVVRPPAAGPLLICKGAVEAVHERCGFFELDGAVHPIDHELPRQVLRECASLAAEGFRVLAVATRAVEPQAAYTRADERQLVLRGYVAFLDPPKDSAREALAALAAAGVTVKVLTGDNEQVTAKICGEVGLETGTVLLGAEAARMTDAELTAAAGRATVMARLAPADKERIVRLLRDRGHVVGFLGDGINDAPALRAADVGISVDTAVDIARESADCILLEKDLRVLAAGVREGRKVFVNILKYVRMGASSNFGNMFSVLGASALLPFVPMTPLQVLTNNLLYDCSQVPIPGDDVDPELVARPRPWSLGQIARFILLVGPVSSLFDATTFIVLWHVFGGGGPGGAAVFHTGWFVESLVTQTLVIHVIRTHRIPFLGSRASRGLSATTLAVIAVGVGLTQSPLGRPLGFVPLPAAYWLFLAVTVAAYLGVTYAVQRRLVRSGWIS
jgi:Mg2+-importing ATPase